MSTDRGWVSVPVESQRAEEPARAEDSSGLATFILQGAEFDGTLRVRGTLRIDCEFKGELIAEEAVILGETAAVQATVRARSVLVGGAVVGAVHGSREVVLRPTARLHGEVETPSLVVERGAVLNATTRMMRPEARLRQREVASPAPEEERPVPVASA